MRGWRECTYTAFTFLLPDTRSATEVVLELRFELFMGKDNTRENLEQALSSSVQCLIVRVEDDTNEYINTILVGHIWSCCAEYRF